MMLKINFVCTNCNMSSIANITKIWTLSQNIFSIVDPIFLFYRIQETGKQSYWSLSFIKIPFKITEYCIIHSVGWLISSRNKKFTRLGFLHEYMMNDCFSRYFFLIKKTISYNFRFVYFWFIPPRATYSASQEENIRQFLQFFKSKLNKL